MIELYKKLMNSEFLSLIELLKLKIVLVLIFLFIFGALTVPVTIFEQFSLDVRIFGPIAFILLFIMSIIMLLVNKTRVSMHFTIYSIVTLTIYYIAISNHFYGLLLIFISLTVMIFYQDIYTYAVYGGALTLYGVYYIHIRGEFLISVNESNVFLSNIVYQFILFFFFFVNLLYFILSDNMYEHLNHQYLKKEIIIKKQRKYCLKFVSDIYEKKGEKQLYDTVEFQKAVSEIGLFINEFLEHNGEKIAEVIEFYFFLHSQDINEVLTSTSLPSITKKYAKQLSEYLLNKDSELNAMIFTVSNQFLGGYPEKQERYEYKIDNLYENTSDRVLAILLIYKLLKSEPMLYDKWGQIERCFTHDEIKMIFQQKELREYLSYEDIKFFMNNEQYFENYL